MFHRRRGMIGHIWPQLRPWAKSPLRAYARQDLQRANRLMEIGDFGNAAALYEKLARKAHDSGRSRQAGHLYVQAARASVLSGQVKSGLDILEQGLSTFAQANLWEVFTRVGSRAIDELRQLGQAQAAQDLTSWLETMRLNYPTPATPVELTDTHRLLLPLKCPSCGATVRPDEVEWIDDGQVTCDYCGSILAAS